MVKCKKADMVINKTNPSATGRGKPPKASLAKGGGEGERYAKFFARELRKKQSDAEIKLWGLLRNRYFSTYKFRRQCPIGPYIVDFCCYQMKLIIEVDGGQHVEQAVYDYQRTKYLTENKYKVLRFWNHEVLNETDSVLEKIYSTLNSPHPHPLPKGEGVDEATPRNDGMLL